MRFRNEKNEIFWKNIIKHNLNRYEFKVMIAFVTDAPTYSTSITELFNRTQISKPHISRALRGLCYQKVLFKHDGKYKLNDATLEESYVPEITSSKNMRKENEASYVDGNGDFKKQAEMRSTKMTVIDENIKKMLKETADEKKLINKWMRFNSDIQGGEVWIKCEPSITGFRVLFSREQNPGMSFTPSAPFEVVEEFCRKILKIESHKEMLNYIHPFDRDRFEDKYKIPK